ncbi:MAG TPA: hypothetical protein H9902_10565 [Candidatus Stackebrandtia faecavium]|nr:hypothetical protein [Candidatus Stackebrandtia faecavium]
MNSFNGSSCHHGIEPPTATVSRTVEVTPGTHRRALRLAVGLIGVLTTELLPARMPRRGAPAETGAA